MKNYLKILALLLTFNYGCNKDKPKEIIPEININCTDFIAAINSNDTAKVEAQLNAFFNSRTPKITTPDPWGYEVHFNTLVSQIKGCYPQNFLSGCYACLQSAPPVATFSIKVLVNGQYITRGVYLYHTARTGGKFIFGRMFDI